MTKQWKLLSAAAVAVAGAGLLMAQTPGLGALHGRGFSRKAMETHFDRVAVYLSLSADQKAQAKTILSDAFGQAGPLLAQLKQNAQTTHQMVVSGTVTDADVQKTADAQAAVISKLIVLKTKTVSQLWALLTPEQREKAQQLHALMHHSGPEDGL